MKLDINRWTQKIKWTSSQLVGCCATVCNAPHHPAHTSVSSHHDIPDHLPNDNYPMDDAGPSGVCHNTLMPHSPPPGLHNNGNVDDDDVSALSTTHHSWHVAECVEWIGQQWWRTNMSNSSWMKERLIWWRKKWLKMFLAWMGWYLWQWRWWRWWRQQHANCRTRTGRCFSLGSFGWELLARSLMNCTIRYVLLRLFWTFKLNVLFRGKTCG